MPSITSNRIVTLKMIFYFHPIFASYFTKKVIKIQYFSF
jgi:hypothetical protein